MSALASIFTAGKALQGEPSLTGTDAGTPDWAKTALSLWGKGADVYTALNPDSSKAPSGLVSQPKPSEQAASMFTQYLPWILGGGVLLVVLYFVSRKS